jgi:hypothetical protein
MVSRPEKGRGAVLAERVWTLGCRNSQRTAQEAQIHMVINESQKAIFCNATQQCDHPPSQRKYRLWKASGGQTFPATAEVKCRH